MSLLTQGLCIATSLSFVCGTVGTCPLCGHCHCARGYGHHPHSGCVVATAVTHMGACVAALLLLTRGCVGWGIIVACSGAVWPPLSLLVHGCVQPVGVASCTGAYVATPLLRARDQVVVVAHTGVCVAALSPHAWQLWATSLSLARGVCGHPVVIACMGSGPCALLCHHCFSRGGGVAAPLLLLTSGYGHIVIITRIVRVRRPLGLELTSFKPPSHGPANTLPALSFRTCCSFHLRSPHSDISPSNMIKTSFTHVSVLSTADGNHPLSQDSDPHLTHRILLTLPCLLSISLSNLLQSNDCHSLSCSPSPTHDRPFMDSTPPSPHQISRASTLSHHHRRTRLFLVPESLYFLTIPAHSCHLVSPKPFVPCKPTSLSRWHQVLTSKEVEYTLCLTILVDVFSDLTCINTVFQYLTPSPFLLSLFDYSPTNLIHIPFAPLP